ncbi:MAG: HypC/HybG/HupF family hydrogenase formation chaperone [Armatimonadota bacterium]|nr:HypC/HybG/HupF family hydrogenase formation chaperone [Armatimonadota bacterium]MDW8155567.1 HypC/HybG/HupF family hydrogenase formation chaperone [Armatimonadota bacterium]
MATPGRVVSVAESQGPVSLAVVQMGGRLQEVSVVAPEPVRPGDWVLVQLGLAVARLREEDARALQELVEDAREP